MERLPICLVGCGGMGFRHLAGYAALAGTGLSNIDLVGVCDIRADAAARAAEEAERLLGWRPEIFTSIDAAVSWPSVTAFDVVTEVSGHAPVVLPALAAGRAVLCEKPLGLTVRACRRMIDAAAASGAILATAENYRRDPPNRVAKAIIDSGVLGDIHLMVQMSVGGDDQVIITPWRHLKDRGGIAFDMGVHYTDIFQYFLGPFESVAGFGFIAEPVRRLRDGSGTIAATGEDSLVATFRMASGVPVQMSQVPSGPGLRWYQRTVHGRNGSLEIPYDRRGGAPVLRLGERVLRGKELFSILPGFALDELTGRLFGTDAAEYELSFPEADRRHIAIELHDFARAVLTGGTPEVDGEGGLTAAAALLGIFESGLLGRTVTMAELLDGRVSAWQDELDRE